MDQGDWAGAIADAKKAGPKYEMLVMVRLPSMANMFHDGGRHDDEIKIRRILLQHTPGDHNEWGAIGDCLISRKDYAAALEAFQAAQSAAGNSKSYWDWISDCQEALGRLSDAMRSLDEHLRRCPTERIEGYDVSLDRYAHRGLLRARTGDPDGAAEDLAYVIRHDPNQLLLYTLRRELKDRPDCLITIFDAALKRLPGHSELQDSLADALMDVRKYDQAEALLRDLAVKRQDSISVWCRLHEIYCKTDDAAKAGPALDRLIALEPNNSIWRLFRAEDRADRGDFEGALVDCGTSAEMAHLIVKDDDRKIEMLEWILTRDPRCAPAWARRGELREKRGRVKEALEDYDRALGIDPRSVLALHLRGCLRMTQGDPSGALDDLTQALEIDSSMFVACADRGRLRRQLKDWGGAVADFEKALAMAPEDWHLRVQVAQWLSEVRREIPGTGSGDTTF